MTSSAHALGPKNNIVISGPLMALFLSNDSFCFCHEITALDFIFLPFLCVNFLPSSLLPSVLLASHTPLYPCTLPPSQMKPTRAKLSATYRKTITKYMLLYWLFAIHQISPMQLSAHGKWSYRVLAPTSVHVAVDTYDVHVFFFKSSKGCWIMHEN